METVTNYESESHRSNGISAIKTLFRWESLVRCVAAQRGKRVTSMDSNRRMGLPRRAHPLRVIRTIFLLSVARGSVKASRADRPTRPRTDPPPVHAMASTARRFTPSR